MGEFQPEIQKNNIDSEEARKKHLEEIRTKLWELKNNRTNNHFKNINPDELLDEDLAVVDKLAKRELAEKGEYFQQYIKDLNFYLEEYVKSHRSTGNEDEFNFHKYSNSRANLRAWIINQLTAQVLEQKHLERPREDIFTKLDGNTNLEKRAA